MIRDSPSDTSARQRERMLLRSGVAIDEQMAAALQMPAHTGKRASDSFAMMPADREG